MRPIYLFILFITSCAQQTILTGGDKDVKAPILLIDSNFQNTSFHYKNLTLPFNERVQFLKDKRALIINPEIINYEIFEEDNTINIVWEDTLQKETTYSFIFMNSIADITENNKIEELNYVISTGAQIDTGKIVGTIYKYPEKKPLKNAFIYAISIADENYTYKGYANNKGNFILKNIKRGDYLLFAFDDENNNEELDTLSEVHGFIVDTITMIDSLLNIDIISYEPDQKITIDKMEFNHLGKLSLTFNMNIDSCSIEDITTGNKYFSNSLSQNHFFYLKDTIQKHIVVVQSKNNFKDTIRISYNLKSNSNTVITYKEQIIKSINANPNFTLEFNQHIKSIDTSLIRVYRDSNKIESNFHLYKNLLTISPIKNDGEFTMELFPKSISGIRATKEDTSKVNFTIKKQQHLSELEIKIKNLPYPKSILQVLKKGEVVMKIPIKTHEIDTIINRCLNGSYQLKLIGDLDENGYWTKGDIVSRKLPEPIFEYNSEIELKKNWTTNITWDFKDEN